jgi:hypothetical protein
MVLKIGRKSDFSYLRPKFYEEIVIWKPANTFLRTPFLSKNTFGKQLLPYFQLLEYKLIKFLRSLAALSAAGA